MLEVPASPKLYTTIYDNFKGVDYTNDVTTIYKRRSPDAINIMPDESGNPVKRFGWETVLTETDFANAVTGGYGGTIEIYRCYYFTLSGVDHIMIFTSAGLFCYRDDILILLEDDGAIIDSVDRTYFFEGSGEAAFYIYGQFNVWKYTYYGGFVTLGDEDITIPLILLSKEANGDGGKTIDDYNLLGECVREQFINNSFNTAAAQPQYRTVLANNVSQNEVDNSRVKVYKFNSNTGEFDISLTVRKSTESIATGECRLISGGTGESSYIEYHDSITTETTGAPQGEDSIMVQYPAVSVFAQTYSDITFSGTATLNGGN